MSKKQIYECDICKKQVDIYEFYRFRRTHFVNYTVGWKTKRFDICEKCLQKIKTEVGAIDDN